MNLKSQLAISQPFLVIVVFKQPENVCIMFDKRVEDLESVILELEKKYKLRKTDKVPTWGLVKKIFEGTLREHMWDILVMNAEYNMSTNKTNFSIHDDNLCTWIGTLFTNMAKHLKKEKVVILKITEKDAMPWWDNQEKIRDLLCKRDNEKRSAASGLTSNAQKESSELPASKKIAIVSMADDLALSKNKTGVAVIESPTKKQGNNGKRCRDDYDDDGHDGPVDYADVCIASMTEIFELAKTQQANNPRPNALSIQALQVEQFRAQIILKSLQTEKLDFGFDDRRSMLMSLIRKSKNEAEILRIEEKLNAFNCVLEASEIDV